MRPQWVKAGASCACIAAQYTPLCAIGALTLLVIRTKRYRLSVCLSETAAQRAALHTFDGV